MEIFIIWFILSILVGLFAGSKGRGSGNWFVVAMLLSPLIALIFVAVMPNLKEQANLNAQPNADTHVKCPDCAELVLKEAKVCKHCSCKLIPQNTTG